MFDFEHIPNLVDWARKHVGLAIVLIVVGTLLYGGHAFIGGYAARFGETFAGSYSKFRRSVKSYTVIDTMLRDYLLQFSASRVGIARFHNSLRDLGDNSMFFVSFETLIAAPGVASDLEDVANLPASVFSLILQTLMDGQPVMVYTKDLEHSPLRELMIRRGVRAALFVPIRDLGDRIVGMLTLSWLNENDVPQGTARDGMIKSTLGAGNRIGGYFSAINKIAR